MYIPGRVDDLMKHASKEIRREYVVYTYRGYKFTTYKDQILVSITHDAPIEYREAAEWWLDNDGFAGLELHEYLVKLFG